MTFKEKLQIEHPKCVNKLNIVGCPYDYGYETRKESNKNCKINGGNGCEYCWNREILEETEKVEQKKKDCRIVCSLFPTTFERDVSELLNDGYVIDSSSCNSKEYKAILIKE